MTTLKLKSKFQTNATLVANNFIDNYMVSANGEFVKVYLFLLRHLNDPCSALTIPAIADCLNHTENDILRAFRYWESQGLLNLEKDAAGSITGMTLEGQPLRDPVTDRPPLSDTIPKNQTLPETTLANLTSADTAVGNSPLPEAVPEKRSSADLVLESLPASPKEVSPSSPEKKGAVPRIKQEGHPRSVPASAGKAKAIPLDSFKAQKELKSLLFIAEQYLGKTLSHTEVDAITYFYHTLGMSADLIEYLIETCVENGHKSIHYIQKVAISWSDEGVETVEQARLHSMYYNKNCYTVLQAFGIKNRGPAASEITYIRKWTEEFAFTLDIIQEACSRTISATHQPSFEYADTILEKWHAKQVRHLQDIAALDAAFQKEKSNRKPSAAYSKQKTSHKNLNNFERRTYDMESLEAKLLNSN